MLSAAREEKGPKGHKGPKRRGRKLDANFIKVFNLNAQRQDSPQRQDYHRGGANPAPQRELNIPLSLWWSCLCGESIPDFLPGVLLVVLVLLVLYVVFFPPGVFTSDF